MQFQYARNDIINILREYCKKKEKKVGFTVDLIFFPKLENAPKP